MKSKCTALASVVNMRFHKLISIHDWKHRTEDRCNPKISRNLGYTKSTALSCILNIFGLIRLIEFMSTRRRNNTNIIKDQVFITTYGYGWLEMRIRRPLKSDNYSCLPWHGITQRGKKEFSASSVLKSGQHNRQNSNGIQICSDLTIKKQ